MECQKEQNLENCACSHPDCPRKGKCCDCIDHHRRKREVPACLFPGELEEKYINNRSIDNFIAAYGEYKENLNRLNEEYPK